MQHQVTRAMIKGAQFYARADRSDPFAFNRAMTHLNNGVANVFRRGKDIIDATYFAEPTKETRHLPDGRPYKVTVYKNMRRP